MSDALPAPGEPGYDEMLLELIILAIQRQGHRPEIPREWVVLVREIERLRGALKVIDSGVDDPQEIAWHALHLIDEREKALDQLERTIDEIEAKRRATLG